MSKRLMAVTGIGVLVLLAMSSSVVAQPLVAVSSVNRAKQVDTVVVGRVIGLMNRDTTIQGVTYRVAIVRVADILKGVKKATTIRVGYIPQPNQPNVPVPLRPGIVRPINLTVGDHGLLFLNKHPKADFYVVSNSNYDFISSTMDGYRTKLTETKMMLKIGDSPKQSLKSKDANERYYAAAVLIQKYRTRTGTQVKLTEISADESKLILTALLNGDWTQPRTQLHQLHPWNMFNRIGLSTNDGWRPPPGARTIEDYYIAAQAWLRENAGKYRIKKYSAK